MQGSSSVTLNSLSYLHSPTSSLSHATSQAHLHTLRPKLFETASQPVSHSHTFPEVKHPLYIWSAHGTKVILCMTLWVSHDPLLQQQLLHPASYFAHGTLDCSTHHFSKGRRVTVGSN